MATRYGTSYFASRSAAIRYYKGYGDDAASVDRKIKEGSIHIGRPPLKAGATARLIDGGTRYEVTENPLRRLNPNRLSPVAFTVKGKRHTGKAKLVGGKVKIFVTPGVARKLNPRLRNPAYTIGQIKSANAAAGQHFFDRSSMKFFHSKVYPSVYSGPGGVYFVTSEYPDTPSQTKYAVRQFHPDSGKVNSVGGVMAHSFKSDAADAAKRMAKG